MARHGFRYGGSTEPLTGTQRAPALAPRRAAVRSAGVGALETAAAQPAVTKRSATRKSKPAGHAEVQACWPSGGVCAGVDGGAGPGVGQFVAGGHVRGAAVGPVPAASDRHRDRAGGAGGGVPVGDGGGRHHDHRDDRSQRLSRASSQYLRGSSSISRQVISGSAATELSVLIWKPFAPLMKIVAESSTGDI